MPFFVTRVSHTTTSDASLVTTEAVRPQAKPRTAACCVGDTDLGSQPSLPIYDVPWVGAVGDRPIRATSGSLRSRVGLQGLYLDRRLLRCDKLFGNSAAPGASGIVANRNVPQEPCSQRHLCNARENTALYRLGMDF